MRITLIDGWKQAWRFHTVLLAALLGALNFAVAHADDLGPQLAQVLPTVLPPDVMSRINRWTPLVLILLRVLRQQLPPPAAAPEPAPAAPAPPPQPGVSP